jgi:NADH:ubiquinone oxidoreductase subunit E
MPWPLFTPRKDLVPILQEAGGPQGQSGQVQKISPPLGFNPRSVQPVASCYTDYATWPTIAAVLGAQTNKTANAHIM